jgi:hypothetical protein
MEQLSTLKILLFELPCYGPGIKKTGWGNAEKIHILWRASVAVRRGVLINHGFGAILQATKV